MSESISFSFPKNFPYKHGMWEKIIEGKDCEKYHPEEPSIVIAPLYQESSDQPLDISSVAHRCSMGTIAVADVSSYNNLEDLDFLHFPLNSQKHLSIIEQDSWWNDIQAACVIEGCLPDVLSLKRDVMFPTNLGQKNIRADIIPLPLSNNLLKDVVIKYKGDLSSLKTSFFVLTGSPVHECGGGQITQIAFILSQMIFVLKMLEKQNIDIIQSWQLLRPEVASGSHIFMNICTMRALRFLWSLIGQKIGVPQEKISYHMTAKTSARMLTKKTPWNNLTRCTYAMMSAFLGGASEVLSVPFVAPLGVPNDASIRLMRNLHALIRYETHIEDVVDPSKGSFFVENLTRQLVSKSWKLFQHIEKLGGFSASISLIEERVMKEKEQREKHFASGEQHVLGASLFSGNNKDDGDIHKYFVQKPYPQDCWEEHISWERCRDEDFCPPPP